MQPHEFVASKQGAQVERPRVHHLPSSAGLRREEVLSAVPAVTPTLVKELTGEASERPNGNDSEADAVLLAQTRRDLAILMGREIREFVPRPKTFVSRTETGVVVRVKGKGEETPRPKSKTDRGII